MKNDIAPKKKRSVLGQQSYETRKRKRAFAHVGAQQNAARIIRLAPGLELYFAIAGQFSFINVLEALIDQIREPVKLDISSWTVAEFELGRLRSYLDSDQVEALRFITDRSFITRHPEEYATLTELIGVENVRVLRCHLKFAVITGGPWRLAVRTSANLNQNRRIENYEISDDPNLAAYMTEIVDEIFTHPAGETIGRKGLRQMRTVGENAPKKDEAQPDPDPAAVLANLAAGSDLSKLIGR
jgi:hypothetical protein